MIVYEQYFYPCFFFIKIMQMKIEKPMLIIARKSIFKCK
jgi:hypothetical protein